MSSIAKSTLFLICLFFVESSYSQDVEDLAKEANIPITNEPTALSFPKSESEKAADALIEGDLSPTAGPIQASGDESLADSSRQTEVLDPNLRDPFKLPAYLINKIEEKEAATAAANNSTVVSAVDPANLEPIRRYPLASYQVIAIVWGIKNPRVIFLDKQNGIHKLRVGDRIGNADGTIERIENGEVVVVENSAPFRIPVRKKSN